MTQITVARLRMLRICVYLLKQLYRYLNELTNYTVYVHTCGDCVLHIQCMVDLFFVLTNC